jgi:hypothetical protein
MGIGEMCAEFARYFDGRRAANFDAPTVAQWVLSRSSFAACHSKGEL